MYYKILISISLISMNLFSTEESTSESNQVSKHSRKEAIKRVMNEEIIAWSRDLGPVELSYKTYNTKTRSADTSIKEIVDKTIGFANAIDSYAVGSTKSKVFGDDAIDDRNIDHLIYFICTESFLINDPGVKNDAETQNEEPLITINIGYPGKDIIDQWHSITKELIMRIGPHSKLIESGSNYSIIIEKKPLTEGHNRYCLTLNLFDTDHSVMIDYSFTGHEIDQQSLNKIIENFKSLNREMILAESKLIWDLRHTLQQNSTPAVVMNVTSSDSREAVIKKLMQEDVVGYLDVEVGGGVELSYKTYNNCTDSSDSSLTEVASKLIGLNRAIESRMISGTKFKMMGENVPDDQNVENYISYICPDSFMIDVSKKGQGLTIPRKEPLVIINVSYPGRGVAKRWYSNIRNLTIHPDSNTTVLHHADTYVISLKKIPHIEGTYRYNVMLNLLDKNHFVTIEYAFTDTDLDQQLLDVMVKNLKSINRKKIMSEDKSHWNLRTQLQHVGSV